MTKKFITLVAVAIFTLSFASCREKTTGEKVGDAVENAVDDVENAVD